MGRLRVSVAQGTPGGRRKTLDASPVSSEIERGATEVTPFSLPWPELPSARGLRCRRSVSDFDLGTLFLAEILEHFLEPGLVDVERLAAFDARKFDSAQAM